MTSRHNGQSYDKQPLGPMFIAPSIWSAGANPGHPLNAEDRAKLALIATITRFGKGETIYKKGDKAAFVYNIISGTVKTYQPLPEGGRFLSGFLFPNDLFGLAEDGAFVNAAEAATDVTVYKIPAAPLEARLRHNPTLDFQVICKLCHDLRAAQRHAFVLSRHRAVSKICLFLQMLEVAQETAGNMPKQIYLSMSRSDIGAYVGISPEAVSRCLRKLTDQKIVRFKDRRHVEVLDRQALEALTSE